LDNVSFDNQISNWKQKNDIIFKLFSISWHLYTVIYNIIW
jgi:hypothetical protein